MSIVRRSPRIACAVAIAGLALVSLVAGAAASSDGSGPATAIVQTHV
jgi:hypothetical protein